MRKVTVPCTSCKKKFIVKQPKKKIHKDGIEGTLAIYYISCSHCKERFVSFVESEKLKKMIKQNKVLQESLKTINDAEMYEKMQEKFQKNVSRIDTIRKDLIFRFSKYV